MLDGAHLTSSGETGCGMSRTHWGNLYRLYAAEARSIQTLPGACGPWRTGKTEFFSWRILLDNGKLVSLQ